MMAEIIEFEFEPIHGGVALFKHRPRINAAQQDLKIVT